jgi:hypothetical protein
MKPISKPTKNSILFFRHLSPCAYAAKMQSEIIEKRYILFSFPVSFNKAKKKKKKCKTNKLLACLSLCTRFLTLCFLFIEIALGTVLECSRQFNTSTQCFGRVRSFY